LEKAAGRSALGRTTTRLRPNPLQSLLAVNVSA